MSNRRKRRISQNVHWANSVGGALCGAKVKPNRVVAFGPMTGPADDVWVCRACRKIRPVEKPSVDNARPA
jgi:hypothetical protein